MIFRQVLHDDLGCASYLVGDDREGVAAVVDPKLDIDEYLRLARFLGVSIEHVLETHTHADHVSGHGRLAAATGARIHVHRHAGAEFDHVPIDDGTEVEIGSVTLRALHTPGHRPEHVAFLVIDRARGPEPWAVLSGDLLFVGDTGRPDLAVAPEEGARDVHRSLHEVLLTLPGHVEVWPGHLGGSLCGGGTMDRKVSSSIDYELRHNPLLSERDPEAFTARVLGALGPRPPRLEHIVALNRGPLNDDAPAVPPLTPHQVERLLGEGALLVDVRTDGQFDDAHVPGAVCITARRSGFGTKLAWLVEDRPVVIVGQDDEDALVAARLAAAVGVTDIAGFLAGGLASWCDEGRPVERIERIDVDELHRRLADDPALRILDVRDEAEWRRGRIAGSTLTPYHRLHTLPEGIDPETPVAAVCASGQRAGVATGLLRRLGVRDVVHVVDGGVATWAAAGRPLER